MAINRQFFFSKVRALFGGHLDQSQVDGMSAMLDAFERNLPQGDMRWLAYMLATAFHETAKTMQPVREAFWLTEDWRRRNLRYYPYYGRGYVQLTWKDNYRRAGARVGADLVANPDLAMRDDIAAVVMLTGMTEGWFRGDNQGRQTLARYFSGSRNDPSGAREIINGKEIKVINGVRTLIADVIAKYHAAFMAALSTQSARVGASFGAALETPEPIIAGPTFAPSLAELPMSYAFDEPGASSDAGADLVQLTATIVTGFVSRNEIKVSEVDELIGTVHSALSRIAGQQPSEHYSMESASNDADAALADQLQSAPPATARKPPATRRASKKRGSG